MKIRSWSANDVGVAKVGQEARCEKDYFQDVMKIRSWSANDVGVAKVGQGH